MAGTPALSLLSHFLLSSFHSLAPAPSEEQVLYLVLLLSSRTPSPALLSSHTFYLPRPPEVVLLSVHLRVAEFTNRAKMYTELQKTYKLEMSMLLCNKKENDVISELALLNITVMQKYITTVFAHRNLEEQ